MPKAKAKKRFQKVIPEKAKVSKEGFIAYPRTDEEEFLGMLLTNQMRNTFYSKASELTEDAIELHKKLSKKDKLFYALALIYARNHGYQRLQPVMGLVNLSVVDPKLFKKVFPKVCLIPTDLIDFIDLCKSEIFRIGVGSGVKKVINEWLKENLSEYYVLKYSTELRDAIRLSRPDRKFLGGEKALLVDYLMRSFHRKKKVDVDSFEKLNAFEKLKTSKDENELIEAIETGKLTHEIVTPFLTNASPKVWETLAKNLPYFALLRHLNTLRRHGIFSDKETVKELVKKLENEETILKSKLFPFRFLSAYKMLSKDVREEYFAEREYLPGKPKFKPLAVIKEKVLGKIVFEKPSVVEKFSSKTPDEILKALEKAFRTSFKNVPEIKGRSVVIVDVSSSMSGRYKEVAATLGIAFILKAEKKFIICFDDNTHIVQVDPDNLLDTIKRITEIGGGGTNLSLPILYMTEKGMHTDNIIVISDMEEWMDEGFRTSFQRYKKHVNPSVKAFLINVSPYRDYPVPADEKDVYVIGGWSEQVLNYISMITNGLGNQVEQIKKMKPVI